MDQYPKVSDADAQNLTNLVRREPLNFSQYKGLPLMQGQPTHAPEDDIANFLR